MANENTRTSNTGLADLRQREGAILGYYNDVANNCTFGVGGLAHHGPCTAEELTRPVTLEEVNVQLSTRVGAAEREVRRRVQNIELTQAQFDALVSFTFNVGAGGARRTLAAANRGVSQEVVRRINEAVYVHPRNSQGRPLQPVRVPGLVNRRRAESLPFRR